MVPLMEQGTDNSMIMGSVQREHTQATYENYVQYICCSA